MLTETLSRVKAKLPIECALKNALLLFVNCSVVLLSSFWWSLLLRHWLLPPVAELTVPLNFVFTTCATGAGGMCTFPTANASLASESGDRIFTADVPYALSLTLTLPDSTANRQLGMFVAVLQLFPDARTWQLPLVELSRSAGFPYRSTLVRLAQRVFSLPLFLIGWRSEQLQLLVQFTTDYRDQLSRPARSVSVQLQHKRIEVQYAQLKIDAVFGFFRQFLYAWPLLSTLTTFLCSLASLSALSFVYWSRKSARHVMQTLETYERERKLKKAQQIPVDTAKKRE